MQHTIEVLTAQQKFGYVQNLLIEQAFSEDRNHSVVVQVYGFENLKKLRKEVKSAVQEGKKIDIFIGFAVNKFNVVPYVLILGEPFGELIEKVLPCVDRFIFQGGLITQRVVTNVYFPFLNYEIRLDDLP